MDELPDYEALTTDQKLNLILERVERITVALRKVSHKFPLLGIRL